MTTKFDLNDIPARDLANYGSARARDLAFDAVKELWARRRAEGMKQVDLVNFLKCDPGWVSKALRGPGNWTMRTFGALAAGMNGEIEIALHAMEDPLPSLPNYHAYADYDSNSLVQSVSAPTPPAKMARKQLQPATTAMEAVRDFRSPPSLTASASNIFGQTKMRGNLPPTGPSQSLLSAGKT